MEGGECYGVRGEQEVQVSDAGECMFLWQGSGEYVSHGRLFPCVDPANGVLLNVVKLCQGNVCSGSRVDDDAAEDAAGAALVLSLAPGVADERMIPGGPER